MKLLINGTRIAGTATDDYTGPMEFIEAPEGFDPSKEYAYIDGQVVLAVPQSVSRAQGKAALIQAGLWSAIVAYVNAIEDETERLLAETALYDTGTYDRSSPFLNTAAAALGMTDADLDELFRMAAAIQL